MAIGTWSDADLAVCNIDGRPITSKGDESVNVLKEIGLG